MADLADAGGRSAQGTGSPDALRRPSRRFHGREWVLAPIIIATVLIVWEALWRTGTVSSLFFPGPSHIARTLGHLVREGELARSLAATVRRVALGFALGAGPALVLGLAMGRSRALRSVVDPLIASVHPVPKIAILPLIMLLFGMGEVSKVVLVALGAFFPVLINTVAGVKQISPIHFDVAENYGAGRFKIFSRVLLPGNLPMILAGMRLAVNIALLLTIAAEMRFAEQGLGLIVWSAWETLRTEELYAGLAVIAVFGVGLNLTLQSLTRRLVPWQVQREI